MSSNNQSDLSPQENEVNPLTFWVAYLPGENDKKNYLSDGQGHLRVYKTEGAMREFLKANLPPATYEMVIVHSVQGEIVVPDDAPPDSKTIPLSNINGENVSTPTSLMLLHTLAAPTVPTAIDQLENELKRRKVRRRRK